MTTLELFCSSSGWEGGTIHDAKRCFAIASIQEMDRLCGLLADKISQIQDPETALWFTRHRLEAIKLHTRAMGRV